MLSTTKSSSFKKSNNGAKTANRKSEMEDGKENVALEMGKEMTTETDQ